VRVRAHLPGYRRLGIFQNAAVRTGVYAGVGLAVAFTVWVVVANRIPALEPFARERNVAGAAAVTLFAAIPVMRFLRFPGHLLASSLVAWGILAVWYRLLCIYFGGLAERHSAVQVFTLGAVVYMILATVSWIGTCLWRVKQADISHPNRRVSKVP
jgi:hypothetical protein